MSLDRALELYRESRKKTLKSLYQQTETMKLKTHEAEADLEEVSASCGHYSFSLLEFGEQLRELLTILDELQLESEERPGGRSWKWLKFWRKSEADKVDGGGSGLPSAALGILTSTYRFIYERPRRNSAGASISCSQLSRSKLFSWACSSSHQVHHERTAGLPYLEVF